MTHTGMQPTRNTEMPSNEQIGKTISKIGRNALKNKKSITWKMRIRYESICENIWLGCLVGGEGMIKIFYSLHWGRN
jgi:hypothetical protein